MTSQELARLITDFSQALHRLDRSGPKDTREAKGIQNVIYNGFKTVSFRDQGERQSLWQQFQELVTRFRETQTLFGKEYERFAATIVTEMDRLDRSFGSGFFERSLAREDFTQLQTELNTLQAKMKEGRWPNKESHDAAWDRLKNLREKLRKKQDEFYGKLKEQRAKRDQHSKELREKMLRTLDACMPDVAIEKLLADFGEIALFLVTGGLFQIASAIFGIKPDEGRKENPLRQKAQVLKELRANLQANSNVMTKEDADAVWSRMHQVQDALSVAFDRQKDESARKKEEWERKNQEFRQGLVGRIEKQSSFLSNLHEWASNDRTSISKMEGALDGQRTFLRSQESRLDGLRDQRSEASNDRRRELVSGWIDQCMEKIRDVESGINDLESKIRNKESRLRDTEAKIRDVERGLEEMREKLRNMR